MSIQKDPQPLHFRLKVDSSITLEEAWKILEELGCSLLYAEEEASHITFITENFVSKELFGWIQECAPYTLPPIDWHQQWEYHGHAFREGCVHIALEDFRTNAPPMRLKPGGGFGDFSHPTTRLMMKMLSSYLQGHVVLDIGSGSGILTIAAILLGSPLAFGIEIDQEALIHSRENAALNGVDSCCFFSETARFEWTVRPQPILIAMNMILSEQKEALESLRCLRGQEALLITSGIRKEEKEDYLQQIDRWGRSLIHVEEEGEWLGFLLK